MGCPVGIQKGFVRTDAALDQYQFSSSSGVYRAIKSLTVLFFMIFSLRKYLLVFLFQFLRR